jgi:hypothetical protein
LGRHYPLQALQRPRLGQKFDGHGANGGDSFAHGVAAGLVKRLLVVGKEVKVSEAPLPGLFFGVLHQELAESAPPRVRCHEHGERNGGQTIRDLRSWAERNVAGNSSFIVLGH